jgi:2-methylisocitrate lyase-like PEP mutase family enzyme
VLNLVPGGKTPLVDLRAAEEMGYKIALVPTLVLATAIAATERVLADLAATGAVPADALAVAEIFERVGAAEWDQLRTPPVTP